jgi:hypothetical protein
MKKKSEKLNVSNTKGCADSGFFKAHYPNEAVEVARWLVIGSYSESELDESTRKEFEIHLAKCTYCSEALKEFASTTELRLDETIPAAVCPSSEILDCYLFDRSSLSTTQFERIEKHLPHCEMCREEFNWLKNLEKHPGNRPKFSPTWMQSMMAAAAALVLAVSAFFFWQKSTGRVAEDELKALAVIQEPEKINYASLLETSEPLKEDLQPLFEQALEAFRTHRFNDAKHHLEKVRQKHPTHAATLYLLSYSYYKLNDPQKAFELCSVSESIHPHSYERCMFLVKIALKTRNYDRARLEISALNHEAPDAPEVKRLYQAIMRLTESRKDTKLL